MIGHYRPSLWTTSHSQLNNTSVFETSQPLLMFAVLLLSIGNIFGPA